MYKIGSMPKSIPIGYTGETRFRKIEIDMNAWLDKMPAGVPSIVHVRPGESKTDAYLAVTEFDQESGILSWTITAADIGTLEGEGEMQVWLEETENDTVNKRGKSVIVTTKVIEAANSPDENVPSTQEAFLEQVTSLKTQTVTAKEAAEDAQAAAEDAQEAAEQAAEDAENVNLHPAYIDSTTKHWMVYDATQHEYVDTEIIAEGQAADVIDDTAGEGDTDKTWSADKLDEELTDVKTAIQGKTETKDSTKTGVDLDVTDENGNVIVRLKDGDIQTKNFASASASKVRDSIETGVDLDISDDDGNVLLRLKGGHIQTKKFTSETIEDRTTYVTVKSSGGDFTNLRDAVDYIHGQGDADPVNHPYVIQIYPGTYDVLDDYTDEEIRTADVADYHNGFFGPYISDGINLVGMGDRETIILTASLDPNTYSSRIRHNISTLNTQGNCRLENLTIIAEDIRYCVHDDFSYQYNNKQYERIVKNCKMIGINLAHNPSCTWGGGMDAAGENAIFEDCDFGTDWGCHFNGLISTRIVFKNCCGRKLRLAERVTPANHYVIIENCNFEMISLMRPSGITDNHIKVISNGCENAYVSSNDGDIVIIGSVEKSPLTTLPVGTMVKRKSTTGNGYESTSDPVLADGFVVANDDYFTYVQRTGFINTRILGLSGFSLGDYITIDGNNKMTTGGTSSNAVGVITFISQDSDASDQGIGFVKLLIGGMK